MSEHQPFDAPLRALMEEYDQRTGRSVPQSDWRDTYSTFNADACDGVDCPSCGSRAGEPCYSVQSQNGHTVVISRPHVVRIKAYREAAGLHRKPRKRKTACDYPGCDFVAKSAGGIGPHKKAKHPDFSDDGVHESTNSISFDPPTLAPVDMVDTLVELMYPNGVPLSDLRRVIAWMAETEALVGAVNGGE